MSTLKLRLEQQSKNSKEIVSYLQSHPRVIQVYYPGLGSDSQKSIFEKEYNNGGSMISFEINGGEKECFQILNRFKIFKLAVSLGSVESLVQHPSSMTHSDMTLENKLRTGITDSLIRLSVGLEDVEDLINDLKNSLE